MFNPHGGSRGKLSPIFSRTLVGVKRTKQKTKDVVQLAQKVKLYLQMDMQAVSAISALLSALLLRKIEAKEKLLLPFERERMQAGFSASLSFALRLFCL